MHHAIKRGMDPDRLYVHEPIANKQKRFYYIRYHAKGRSGKAKHDIS